jgi:hypothetical protein
MDLTLTVQDELATRLRSVEDRLPEILELGLREWLSNPPGYTGLTCSRRWPSFPRRKRSSP